MSTKVFVEIKAYWGNDDAESTIKVSRRQWRAIEAGGSYQKNAWSYYEGRRHAVRWSFSRGQVNIDGEDAMQCIVDRPLDDLIVTYPSD